MLKHTVVNPWNDKSDDIVTAPSLNSFKSRLNKLWKPRNKFEAGCYNRRLLCIDIVILKCHHFFPSNK